MTIESEVQKLRKEGKKYREISETLKCKISLVSYYATYKNTIQNRRKVKDPKLKEIFNKSSKKGKDRNREYVKEFLSCNPCIDCGNNDLRVLDFDHVRGNKIKAISRLVRDGANLERLKQEISKCEVRCANCHRIVTFERRKQNT